jgi:cyclopropane fatty-acyl-phospholipid synthase-like methyltransferase
MLERCRSKARSAGLKNVLCRMGGFLTYHHNAAPADAMVSVAVLHHLPDFWKQIGLRRAADMLKRGGRLFLFDIVFPSGAPDLERRIRSWVEAIRKKAGPGLAKEAEVHVRKEFSTYDWVMEGLLRKAGFRIDRKRIVEAFQTSYVCTRI